MPGYPKASSLRNDKRNHTDYRGKFSNPDPIDDDIEYYVDDKRASNNAHFGLRTIGFRTKDGAISCLRYLEDEIGRRGYVTVDDLFSYVGRRCSSRQGDKWGWSSVSSAVVKPTQNGWRIQFPEVIDLRRLL